MTWYIPPRVLLDVATITGWAPERRCPVRWPVTGTRPASLLELARVAVRQPLLLPDPGEPRGRYVTLVDGRGGVTVAAHPRMFGDWRPRERNEP